MSRLAMCSSFLSMFSMLVISSADCAQPVFDELSRGMYDKDVSHWIQKSKDRDTRRLSYDDECRRNVGKKTVDEVKRILKTGKYSGDGKVSTVKVDSVDYRAVRFYDSSDHAGNIKEVTLLGEFDVEINIIGKHSTEYSFVKQNSAEAAINFRDPLNGKIAVLNFGNAVQACGGFLNGRGAQEESLSRASTISAPLMRGATEDLYYGHNMVCFSNGMMSERVVVAPDALIFRTDKTGEGWKWIENPVHVSIVTASAFDERCSQGYKPMAEDVDKNTKRLIRNAVLAAIHNGCETFVLGAFGCGVCTHGVADKETVYHKIAGYFKEILVDEELGKYFKKIVFPISDDNKRPIFENEFKRVDVNITHNTVFGQVEQGKPKNAKKQKQKK